ncbi:biopolymer transporter ExbD [bacterium]|jgi:biopolymer transport protein TolR|nr:biopolymer transporter ExbD [bacterium]NBW57185.1 biopolymer transporter ExbD [bacterium]NBX72552.1 biopolymer transporter ExbD [bacterium]
MKTRYSSLSLDPQINIVPYLDIFLVLTVILMASISPYHHQVEVELPKISRQEEYSEKAREMPLIVTLDKKGGYHLRNLYMNEHDLTSRNLLIKLKVLYQKNSAQYVILEADKDCSYDNVMRLMSIMHQAGFMKIGLVTDPESVYSISRTQGSRS